MLKMDQTPFDSLDNGLDLLGLGVGHHLTLAFRLRPLRKSDVEVHT
jgi:hypothetical protein